MSKHKNDNIKIIVNNDENNEFIYLLKEREFVKTKEPIYKIGKTKQENLNRIKSYPNGSKLLFYNECSNCDEKEKIILNKFKELFIHKKDIGNEYFMGDYILMKNIIYDITCYNNQDIINNNITNEDICNKCNKIYKTKKSLIEHNKKCIGLNVLTCPKCMITFSSRFSKSNHIKKNNCKPVSIIHHLNKIEDFIINDFGNERIDYLENFTNKDNIKDLPIYIKIIKYIEFKYFNHDFPENNNIKFENNYCSIRENGEWKFKDLNNLIHDLIQNNKLIVIYNNFIEFIDENNEKNIEDNYTYIKNELKTLIKSFKIIN